MNQMQEPVRDIAVGANGTVYAAGSFNFPGLNNKLLKGVAQWNGSYWTDIGGGLDPSPLGVYAIAEKEGALFVGGAFFLPGQSVVSHFAMWTGVNWVDYTRDLNGWVLDIVVTADNQMIVGGNFGTTSNMLNRIARFTQAKWEPVGAGFNGPVHTLAAAKDGTLYAGGDFTASNGLTMVGVARFVNGVMWLPLGSGLSGGAQVVRALEVDETNTLYVGGNFVAAGGVTANNVARWNGVDWTALGSGTTNGVECLALGKAGQLFIGGFPDAPTNPHTSGSAKVQVRATRELTIDGASVVNATYEDADLSVVVSTNSPVDKVLTVRNTSVASVAAQGTDYALKFEGVGSTYLVAEQSGNWEFLPTKDSLAIHVAAKALQVTAEAKTKTYGENDPALTYQVQPQNKATWTGVLAREVGEDVDTYEIQKGTLSAGANYDVTYTPANFVIGPKALQITAKPSGKNYGDSDPDLIYQQTGLLATDAITGSLEREVGEDVATYDILQGSLSAGLNYEIEYLPSVFTISKRPVTVTMNAQAKVYGSSDPTLTYSATGLLQNESLTGSLERKLGGTVGSYLILPGTPTGANYYDLQFEDAELDITPKPLQVTAIARSKKVGDTDPALTYESEGLEDGDILSGSLSRKAGETAGTYPILLGTLDAGANYTIEFQSADFTIRQSVGNLPWQNAALAPFQMKNGILYVGNYSGPVRVLNAKGSQVQEIWVHAGGSYPLDLKNGQYLAHK